MAVLLANVIDRADIRMVQRRGRLRLALKTGECLWVARHIFGQELQGDEAAQADVLSLVDHTHATTAEPLQNAIVRDGLPQHRARILRG